MKKALAVILPLLLTYPFSILALELYQAKEGVAARKRASEDSPVIYHFKAGEEFKVARSFTPPPSNEVKGVK